MSADKLTEPAIITLTEQYEAIEFVRARCAEAMTESRYILAASRENCARLVPENSHKGLMAIFNLLDAGDDRVRKYRTELFNLIHQAGSALCAQPFPP